MASKLDADRIKLARKQWKQCADAEENQRTRIVAAKKFRALDQWPEALKVARSGGNAIAGMPAQPARPCFVVDRLNQPLRQISNQIKNADFGLDVKPNGGGADDETAEIIQGAMRRMQAQAREEAPLEWAADGAIEGGIGWFRLRTEYVHTDWAGDINDPAIFDQELRLERITNNLTVYCDPWAVDPTRAKARFMFVTEDCDRDALKSQYGDAIDFKSLDDFGATGDMPGWVEEDTIRIAEWWRCEYKDRPLYWLKDGTIGEGEPPKGAEVRMQRVMRVPRIRGSKITATQELEKWEWAGLRIPLFPVLGEELNVDGEVVLRGIIEPGMDAQRMVNFAYSAGIENFAIMGRKAPIVTGASIQNYKQIWQTRTLFNHSFLPIDAFDEQGRPLPEPKFDMSEPPIQAAVEIMRISEDAIKASTNTGDASLGNTNPNERSGRALAQLQASSDLANSNYPDNVKRAFIAAANEAIYVLPRITRKGQILHILGRDDEAEQIMVGQPYSVGKDGRPMPSPQEVTPEIARLSKGVHKFYDLNNGTYSVTATIGKATATKREEGAAALGELIPHLPPEMAAVATPDYVEQLSFPGAHQIAEKLRKALPPQLQEQDEESTIPPEAQQQIGQLQQQVAELQPLANDNLAKAHIEKMRLDAKREEIAFQREKMGVDSETKLAVAELGAKVDRLALFLEERARIGAQAHDVGMAAMGHAHNLEAGAVAHDQALEQGSAASDQVMAQQANQAALQPPPAEAGA